MSPTAIYSAPATSASPTTEGVAVVPFKGPALAIGSLVTAEDGKYQSLIKGLEKNRQVERQMLDRLVDGGALLPSVDSK
jgi:anamorsin